MDTLTAFDILRDGGFDDREARAIVRAGRATQESLRAGREPDSAVIAEELSAGGFDGERARALARALREVSASFFPAGGAA